MDFHKQTLHLEIGYAMLRQIAEAAEAENVDTGDWIEDCLRTALMARRGIKAIRWAVGITTTPREPNTIDDTLESFASAGWHNHIKLFNDPESWGASSRIGPYQNFLKSLRHLVDTQHDADVILIAQDDISISRNLRRFLEADANFSAILQRKAIISLYCAAPNFSEDAAHRFRNSFGNGWHRVGSPKNRSYGALAYAMSRRTAEAFLQACPGAKKTTMTDFWIGRFCHLYDFELWTHSPSLVRHEGAVSSLTNPGGVADCRQCREFATTVQC